MLKQWNATVALTGAIATVCALLLLDAVVARTAGSDRLADTGSPLGPALIVAVIVLVLGGAALLLLGRRKRNQGGPTD